MSNITNGVIISGGQVDDAFVLRFLQNEGFVFSDPCPWLIAADAGLKCCSRSALVPAHIVGDFDSAAPGFLDPYRSRKDIEIRQFIPEKDYTDTEIAVELAVSLGWKQVTVLGGTGSRLDHVLGNIQVLQLALSKGMEAILIDPHNRITLHREPFSLRKETQWGKYVSFFAWGGRVPDLTLSGFAYPLNGHCLDSSGSLAVSNEITEEYAEVRFSGGMVLCIESKD